MKNDQDIIDKTDEWKRKEFEIKEKEIKLRHERWLAFGRFIKLSIVVLAGFTALFGVGYFTKIRCDANAEEEAIKKIEEQKSKKEFEKQLNLL